MSKTAFSPFFWTGMRPCLIHRFRVLNGRSSLDDSIDLEQLASSYALSGGAITNVVRYGAISALQMNRTSINRDDLVKGVAKELRKEGKTI